VSRSVVLLSGGSDSAVVAALEVEQEPGVGAL